eukprot:1487415-Lingulodinium_polyedra.AAC.1
MASPPPPSGTETVPRGGWRGGTGRARRAQPEMCHGKTRDERRRQPGWGISQSPVKVGEPRPQVEPVK